MLTLKVNLAGPLRYSVTTPPVLLMMLMVPLMSQLTVGCAAAVG